jgi:UDP-N-acetyl-D-galactosamine dehydrogenase
VDPYYLIQRALTAGYYPDILMACRRINDHMGKEVVAEVIKLMIKKGQVIKAAKALVLGFTFKENCPDLRNTRVVDLVEEFKSYGVEVDIHDPWADAGEAMNEYGLTLQTELPTVGNYQAIVLAVAHDQYCEMGIKAIRALGTKDGVVYDIKGLFNQNSVDGRL